MWAQVRSVMTAEAWPRNVCTCLTEAPPEISAEAAKCRNECEVTSTPAAVLVSVSNRLHGPGRGGQTPQPPGGAVAVHPGATGVEQDRPVCSGVYRPVHCSPHGRRQRHEDDSGALADHPQHGVP